MPSNTVSASSVYVEFGYEGEFGGGSTSFPMLFGKEQKLTSLEFNVNQQPLGQLYSPEINCFVYGRNEGSASVEYVLAQPWNLSSIFGAPFSEETVSESGIFTHTWTSDPDSTSPDWEAAVVAITIDDSGNGDATNATVTVANSDLNSQDPASTATASAVIVDGTITEIIMLNSGYGYQSIPTVSITTDDTGSPTATATISPVSTRNIDTMALEIGVKSSLDATNDFVRNIAGAISPTMSFRMSLNEPIRVTQELKWGIETTSATIDTSIGTLDGFTPYVFADAEIQLLDGTTVATVQDFDLNINSNAELLYELGTANASGAWRKILEMTGKINVTVKDSSFYDIVAGRAEQASMTVIITNGLADTAEKTIKMKFLGIGFGTHNNTGIEPGELVLQNMDFQCRTVTITATNDRPSQPI